jgi:hypothetical protein
MVFINPQIGDRLTALLIIPQNNLYIKQSEKLDKFELLRKSNIEPSRLTNNQSSYYKLHSTIEPNDIKIKLKRNIKFLGVEQEDPINYAIKNHNNLTTSADLPHVAIQVSELFPESKDLAVKANWNTFNQKTLIPDSSLKEFDNKKSLISDQLLNFYYKNSKNEDRCNTQTSHLSVYDFYETAQTFSDKEKSRSDFTQLIQKGLTPFRNNNLENLPKEYQTRV